MTSSHSIVNAVPTLHFRQDVRRIDEAAIGEMVAATTFFSHGETAIAVELVQERLSKGTDSGYEFVLAEGASAHGPATRLVGYTCFGEIPCTVGSYDIYWIVVDPAHQRHGVGRQLMNRTRDEILRRNGRQIYIDTSGRPQYAPTRSFYERCGFSPVAELPDFYGPGDAKIIYNLKLGC